MLDEDASVAMQIFVGVFHAGFGRYWAVAGAVILGGLLGSAPVGAEDGRDFYAFHDTTDILDLGEQVGMTFSLDLHNDSRTDVAEATVTLEDPTKPGTSFGIFTAVSVAYRDSVRLSGSVTVPRSEYDSW